MSSQYQFVVFFSHRRFRSCRILLFFLLSLCFSVLVTAFSASVTLSSSSLYFSASVTLSSSSLYFSDFVVLSSSLHFLLLIFHVLSELHLERPFLDFFFSEKQTGNHICLMRRADRNARCHQTFSVRRLRHPVATQIKVLRHPSGYDCVTAAKSRHSCG